MPNHTQPIAEIGIECKSDSGSIYLDYLTWDEEPDVVLTQSFGSKHPSEYPMVWRSAWVDAVDETVSWG